LEHLRSRLPGIRRAGLPRNPRPDFLPN